MDLYAAHLSKISQGADLFGTSVYNNNCILYIVHKNWLGGNQRELARQKNSKKQDQTKAKKADDKDGNKGMTLQDRRQR